MTIKNTSADRNLRLKTPSPPSMSHAHARGLKQDKGEVGDEVLWWFV